MGGQVIFLCPATYDADNRDRNLFVRLKNLLG